MSDRRYTLAMNSRELATLYVLLDEAITTRAHPLKDGTISTATARDLRAQLDELIKLRDHQDQEDE